MYFWERGQSSNTWLTYKIEIHLLSKNLIYFKKAGLAGMLFYIPHVSFFQVLFKNWYSLSLVISI